MRIPRIPEKVVDVLLKIGIEILKLLKKVNRNTPEKGIRNDNINNDT